MPSTITFHHFSLLPQNLVSLVTCLSHDSTKLVTLCLANSVIPQFPHVYPFCSSNKEINSSFIYFQREGKGEREGEKHWSDASHTPPNGGLVHSPGMHPDWESNRQPLGSQAGAQSTESHQPGQEINSLQVGAWGSVSPTSPTQGNAHSRCSRHSYLVKSPVVMEEEQWPWEDGSLSSVAMGCHQGHTLPPPQTFAFLCPVLAPSPQPKAECWQGADTQGEPQRYNGVSPITRLANKEIDILYWNGHWKYVTYLHILFVY